MTGHGSPETFDELLLDECDVACRLHVGRTRRAGPTRMMGNEHLMVRPEPLEEFLGKGDPVFAVQHDDWRTRSVAPNVEPALSDCTLFTLHVRTPPGRASEADVDEPDIEGPRDALRRLHEEFGVEAGQVAVDQALVVADQPLDVRGQPHVVESLGVEPQLLLGKVGVVLAREWWASGGRRVPSAPASAGRAARCPGG